MRSAPKAVLTLVTSETSASQTEAEPGGASASDSELAGGEASAAGPGDRSEDAASPSGARRGPTRARLETLRTLVENGEYPVDLDRLASRIVEDEKARSGRS